VGWRVRDIFFPRRAPGLTGWVVDKGELRKTVCREETRKLNVPQVITV